MKKFFSIIFAMVIFVTGLFIFWNQSERAKQKALHKLCIEEPSATVCSDLPEPIMTDTDTKSVIKKIIEDSPLPQPPKQIIEKLENED
mgnify:CR=1 FL=1|tara:strand:+ start:198 stop:461 length:264 start_codon:yes stop_codon:yes gene_type:complete